MNDKHRTVGTSAAQAGVSGFMVQDLLRYISIASTVRPANFDADPVRHVANQVGERITFATGKSTLPEAPLLMDNKAR